MNLPRLIVTGLIKLYRLCISPFLGQNCRFYPSCSCYAEQAITRFGLSKGSLLAVRRLLRCHPFHEGGFDPVPDAEQTICMHQHQINQQQPR